MALVNWRMRCTALIPYAVLQARLAQQIVRPGDGADQRLYTLSQSWVIGHTHQEIDRVQYSPGIYSDDESGRESKSC